MKKITLLFTFLITSIGFSQTYDLLTNGDFESGKDNWGGSEFTVVAGEAFFSTTNAAGDPWSTQLTYGGLAFENTKEYVLTFSARAAADRNITVAIQNVGAWDDQFRQENISLTTTMTEYTYTFNANSDNTNVQIGFLMAGFGSTDAVYYDNISLITAGTKPETCSDGILNNGEIAIDCGGPNCAPCASPPTTAPTAPPARNDWDVISLYSEAYTQTAVTNFDAGWCGAGSVEEVTIAQNKVQAYKGNACQGIEFTAIDASALTHMHVDLYIDETNFVGKVFNLKFVDTADDNVLEVNFNDASTPMLEGGKWISIDVPVDLSNFDKLNEFVITNNNNNNSWYDNLYFYREATASIGKNNVLNISLSPNPARNTLKISAKNSIENATIYNVLGKKVKSILINKNEENIDVSALNSGIYILKYRINNKIGVVKFVKN